LKSDPTARRVPLGYIKVTVEEIPGYLRADAQAVPCAEAHCVAAIERQIRFTLTVSPASFTIPVCLEHASAAAAQAARDNEADARAKASE
jgi:hypothetical protein